jgi:hypothetical protein
MNEPERSRLFDVTIEQHRDGWLVVVVADGQRNEMMPAHPTNERAQYAAGLIESATTRWADSASRIDREIRHLR